MRSVDRWSLGISAALIAFFLLAALSEASLKSPTADEPPHIAAGLSYFVTHEIFRANPQHPPLLKELSGLSMMAAGIRWPHTPDADYLAHGDDPARVFGMDWGIGNDIIRTNGPDRILFWARLPLILIGALTATLLFLWGRQLLGSVAAAGAVFLFVLDPIIVAHAQLVTTDVGVACFSVLALFALWKYLERPGWVRLALCGLSLGAALDAKFSGVLLLPIFGLLLLASIRWPLAANAKEGNTAIKFKARPKDPCPCGSGKKYKNCHGREGEASTGGSSLRQLTIAGGALAVMGVVAFLLVQATYFFPSDLTMYFKCAKMVNADHDPQYLAYMAGELSSTFSSYFPLAYLLKEPLPSIAFTSIGLVALVRRKSIPVLGKLFLLLPPAVFFGAAVLKADDLGVRYIIPALPFLHLVAGLGIASLIEIPRPFRWAPLLAGALGCWLLVSYAGVYPDHLSYFNESACLLTQPGRIGLDGGTRCGPAWLDDSNVDWGQGFKQLKAWLDRNAGGRPVKFAFTTGFPPEAYGIRCQHLQPDDLMREPEPGLYAVSAHLVARAPALNSASNWLRGVQPRAIVGHAIYIYDIPAR